MPAEPPGTLYISEKLGAHHDRSTFVCESERQAAYFRQIAGQHQQKGLASVFVLIEIATGRIAGYYTLSMHAIDASEFPAASLKALKLPRGGGFPCALIGRLARHTDFAGKGVGQHLVYDALWRTQRVSDDIAAVAVTVDADGDAAHRFWLAQGFIPFAGRPESLFLPMANVRARFAGL